MGDRDPRATVAVTRPRLLDLFGGAGGAAVGYHRAGFDVFGVDINPQPRYPFPFVQADALTYPLNGYDAIHASPPCQGYSAMRCLPWLRDRDYPMLLEPVWRRLTDHGVPFVIENVERAPMPSSTVLCGRMFGLPLYRHRRFGSNVLLLAPAHPRHETVIHPGRRNLATRYRQGGGRDVTGVIPRPDRNYHLGSGGNNDEARKALGIDWMRRDELSQAIPPAYTEWIGTQLLQHLGAPWPSPPNVAAT